VTVCVADCSRGDVGDEELGLAVCDDVVDEEFAIV
jgi:hypothetical protein